MAQEQKESIDRTFVQFMQLDLGLRTGVHHMEKPFNINGYNPQLNQYSQSSENSYNNCLLPWPLLTENNVGRF